jgi:hypothetical protein
MRGRLLSRKHTSSTNCLDSTAQPAFDEGREDQRRKVSAGTILDKPACFGAIPTCNYQATVGRLPEWGELLQ